MADEFQIKRNPASDENHSNTLPKLEKSVNISNIKRFASE